VLDDDRRYVLVEVERGGIGFWFKAVAADGRRSLMGNLRIDWDAPAQVWRPAGSTPSHAPAPLERRRHERARLV
jgi:hypothetical protein